MKNKILTSLLSASLLCGFHSQAMAQGKAEDQSPADMNLPQYMEVSDKFSVFNKLLVATGWADSLVAERDEEYERLYNQGHFGTPPAHPNYTPSGPWSYPKERKYGFTILAETDSVFEAMTGMKAKDITPGNIISSIAALGIKGSTDNNDYKSADNTLNLFVSYHLLPVAVSHENLVRYFNSYGYDPEDPKPTINMTEYYETMGKGRRLLKMSASAKSGGVHINRYVKLDPETYMDVPEATDGFIPGILVEDNAQRVTNGYVYPIKEPLAYTDVTAGKVLGQERIRFDLASLLPELTNNGIRIAEDVAIPTTLSYAYFDNMDILSSRGAYYLCGYLRSGRMSWNNYQGDEFNMVGASDVIIKLPPVPQNGIYELRMGSSNNNVRGIYQFFVGTDKSNMVPCGLPIDMTRYMSKVFPNYEDTGNDMIDRMTDLQLREKRIMKAPYSYHMIGGTPLRNNTLVIRNIIDRFYLVAGQTYYLRVSSCNTQAASQMQLDYFEWVPKAVYANPTEAEDLW